jgi:hypothetical protein
MPRSSAEDAALKLSPDEMQELWLGPNPHFGPLLRSPEAARAAWEANRTELMRLFGSNGRRPMAWWTFDAPGLGLTWPGLDREHSYLYEADVLSETEVAELMHFWRYEFERSFGRDFFVTENERVVEGKKARLLHWKWADIPRALITAWTTERKQRRASQKPPGNPSSQAI